MDKLYRQKLVKEFNFAQGATVNNGGFVSLQGTSSVFFVFPSEFNGDQITLVSSIPGDTGFQITAATGRVNLTSDQALLLAPMPDIRMTTNNATAAPATVYMACLDG